MSTASKPHFRVKDDPEIFRRFSEYVYLPIELAAQVLGRGVDTVQKQFKVLFDDGYLNRVQESAFGKCLYFLDRKGGEQAASLGFFPEPRWVQKKSPRSIKHDLRISRFHYLLETAFPGLKWEQWRTDMRDIKQAMNCYPDARFMVNGDPIAFLEVVEANESGHRTNEKNLTEKLQDYVRHGVDRTYITMPTSLRVERYLEKLSAIVPDSSIWITDEASIETNLVGKIWRTPANYKDRTYSILKPES